MTRGLMATDLRLPGARRGKVRDLYELPPTGGEGSNEGSNGALLIVATDRLSAFDVVLPTLAPGKGRMLTSIAAWWLRWLERRGVVSTHLRSTETDAIPASAFDGAETTRASLDGRVMIGRRCRVVPIECVVRGYLEGSGWADYQQTGGVCGVSLPAGLRRCERLPTPIFTPATKAEDGAHDENISFDEAVRGVGGPLMEQLRDQSLAIYRAAAAHAEARGIILADTKFEFGLPINADADGGERAVTSEPMLIDEALTPDSSRFWPMDAYEPGRTQPSFDKQYVREHLETLVDAGQWNKSAPGPALPDAVIEGTLARYREAMERLTAE
ncbi:MAG: phosphoribosylaminoimidazolesuccinocarboxamide synthase [Planctomycetota bacterium]